MKEYSTKAIPIANLAINIENPRYSMVGSQREAIDIMIEDQENKLFNLAKDMVAHGPNPSDLTIVAPHEREKGKYNVLEGNRRVTAIKLLETPDIIGDHRKSYKRKFKKLHAEYMKARITGLQCVVFRKPENAYKWIKLKHTGENDGVGTVRWDAQQTARFDEKIQGISPIAIQALDFLKDSQYFDEDLKEKLSLVPSSSLVRLLGDKDVKEFLGLSTINGILQTDLAEKELTKGLTKIIKDLLKPGFSVKTIYYKDDRLRYLESFKQNETPDLANTAKKAWNLLSPSSLSKSKAGKKRARRHSTERKTIIPKEFSIIIADIKTGKIYRELKRLDCHQFVNAGAVLLRVFVEHSIDAFIAAKKIQGLKQRDALGTKVQKVADYLKNSSKASDHELKGIRISAENRDSVFSIDTFHNYVHNRHFSPIAGDLKVAWDNIAAFISILWKEIK